MATTESTLESQNFLQPTGFKLVVNRKRFKNLEFFAQSVSHPDVSLPTAVAPFRRSDLYTPGEKMEFGTLTVDVILDENMNVYKEIMNWMEQTVQDNYKAMPTRTNDQDVSIYDIALTILSSHNNMIDKITYKGAFPINIGVLNFQSTVDNVQYLTFPVTFYYTTFTITE